MAINKVIYGGNTLIDLTGDTVTPETLLAGKKAHDTSGVVINGTCTYDADTSDATAAESEILPDLHQGTGSAGFLIYVPIVLPL